MTAVSVSGMRQVTHAIYIASWCRWMVDTRRTTLVLTDYDTDRHNREFRRRVRVALSSEYVHWADPSQRPMPEYYVAVGIPGIKPWLRVGRQATTISVDEGLSSYGDTRSRLRAMRREGAKVPSALLRSAGGIIAARHICDEEWRTYRWNGTRWDVNRHVVDEFRRRLTGPAADMSSAVFLAQPWVRLGLVSASEYRSHLGRVRSRCERAGLRLIVRPHHSDDPSTYDGFETSVDDGPAETARPVVDAPVVLGEHSSALINVAAFGTSAVRRVASPAGIVLDRALSSRQRSLLDQYLPQAVSPEDVDLPC